MANPMSPILEGLRLAVTSGHNLLDTLTTTLASGAVAEAVAHAIPDPATGQATRLVVRGTGDVDLLSAHLKRELPSHMQPKIIDWRDELPRNANGKIDRSAIRSEVG